MDGTSRSRLINMNLKRKMKKKKHRKRHPNSLYLRETFHGTRQTESCKLLLLLLLFLVRDKNGAFLVLESERHQLSPNVVLRSVDANYTTQLSN